MVSKSINTKKTSETIKQELPNSLQENDNVEEKELNETANNINNSQEAIVTICSYEDIIKTQDKKVIRYISKHGELLKKFKDTENFFMSVKADQGYILKFHFISF